MNAELSEKGFAIIRKVLSDATVADLISDLSRLDSSGAARCRNGTAFGVRNLLNLSPKIREFAASRAVRKLAESILSKNAKVVRAIYFDKTPEANWKVPWHQDLTIAVREKREAEGFTAWTRKAEIWHAQPPTQILERMLTLRFHLDDADETNGALKVVSGSHKRRLSSAEVRMIAKPVTICEAARGDVLLMRPLLVHSSSAGTNPRHRRVIHFEVSADDLPGGLNWYGS
jgi:ectoine hydroxylase-related dioxygenase (phytanoyl-CoA dioxygenase family)